WCNDKPTDAAHVDAVRQLATPIPKNLILRLLEEQMSSAARRFCHRDVGEAAAVGAQKSVEGCDAVIAARMPIAVDDDERSTPDNDGRQGGGISVPPPAYLLLLGTSLLLPAS